MAIVRWDPARELTSLQSEMNRLFGTFFDAPSAGAGNGGSALRRWYPAMDLVEEGGDLVLRADLPGVAEENVSIEVQDNVLTVSGERGSDHEMKAQSFHRVERMTGSFARSLTLPERVDAEAVTARFDRGVLEVRVPKPEEREPRKVAIQAGQPRTIEAE